MASNNNNFQTSENITKQKIDLKPRLGGFLWSYIIFSLPGFITGIVWFVISIIILFSTISTLSSVNNKQDSSNTLNLSEIQNSGGNDGILIYDLKGPINTGTKDMQDSDRNTGIYSKLVARDFEEIKNNKNIKNVVFRLNTPGGTIFDSQIVGDLIADLTNNKGQKEVVFYFDQIVASGGLFLSYKNTNNYVVGSPYGQTGSIGVILTLPNFKGLADKVGYNETIIKSAASKDIGSPLRDLSNDEKNFLQRQVDKEYDKFLDIVSSGRKINKEKVKSFANGYVYANSEAKDLGLIDDIGDINKSLDRAVQNAGLGKNYKVWEVKSEIGLLQKLISSQSISTFLGLPQNTTKLLDKATLLEPGKMYMVDINRV